MVSKIHQSIVVIDAIGTNGGPLVAAAASNRDNCGDPIDRNKCAVHMSIMCGSDGAIELTSEVTIVDLLGHCVAVVAENV